MILAHISDLHLAAPGPINAARLCNKRITGYLNWRLRRAQEHPRYAVAALARAVRERGDIDHLVITGDLTNLSLDAEFEAARAFLRDEIGLPPSRVSIVPGNHDAYTHGAHRTHRFERYFAEYIAGDLPHASGLSDEPPFPYVRLRGPAAIIGLSSAKPRPPLFASGAIGELQLLALAAVLEHAEVRARLPVLLLHHPWHPPPNPAKAFLQGLQDRDDLGRVLARVPRGLLLHGHLHRRIHRQLPTEAGSIDAIGTTSASLIHADAERQCGFNVYRLDERGLLAAEAFVLDAHGSRFEPAPLPTEPLPTEPLPAA